MEPFAELQNNFFFVKSYWICIMQISYSHGAESLFHAEENYRP